MRVFCQKLVANRWFDRVIVALIVANAVALGLETNAAIMDRYGAFLLWFNHAVLTVFVLEAVIKITAVWPRLKDYFGDGWNLFDFSIVVLSLVPATGEYAMIARLARLLRVLRLVSALPELRIIVATLVRSIPGFANVLLLLFIIFYMYAVAGYHLLHQHDPEHWGSLGLSLLTLFRVLTLEDWTDVMYTAMEMNTYMWIFFVSFVVTATFVVINMFIAVVINNLEEAKLERQKRDDIKDLLRELRAARRTIDRVERTLDRQDE